MIKCDICGGEIYPDIERGVGPIPVHADPDYCITVCLARISEFEKQVHTLELALKHSRERTTYSYITIKDNISVPLDLWALILNELEVPGRTYARAAELDAYHKYIIDQGRKSMADQIENGGQSKPYN